MKHRTNLYKFQLQYKLAKCTSVNWSNNSCSGLFHVSSEWCHTKITFFHCPPPNKKIDSKLFLPLLFNFHFPSLPHNVALSKTNNPDVILAMDSHGKRLLSVKKQLLPFILYFLLLFLCHLVWANFTSFIFVNSPHVCLPFIHQIVDY